MDMAGKTCIVTGANSGLGFAASKQFAKLGCSLILVCRPHKGRKRGLKDNG